tara:strand:+ start:94 stop:672 length:579 start_codon:yes stop_codon:yes gene_type:complete
MDPKNLIKNSKNLSKILRHSAKSRGLKIDDGGWIKLDDILKFTEFKNITIQDILYIVDNNDKKRFSIEHRNSVIYIKANQGHSIKSIKDELLLNRITDPNYITFAIHSTFKKSIKLIKENGLSKMNRNHIHMAKSRNVKSGVRKNADVFIYIDVTSAINDGIKFYESENGVILSPGINGVIPSKYFLSIEYK